MVDPVDADDVFVYMSSMMWEPYFATRSRSLPPAVIREALGRVADRLAEIPRRREVVAGGPFSHFEYLELDEERFSALPLYAAVFLVTLLADSPSDTELVKRWPRALDALCDLHFFRQVREQRARETIEGIARVPWLVAAAQAVAVGVEHPSPSMVKAIQPVRRRDMTSGLTRPMPVSRLETTMENASVLVTAAASSGQGRGRICAGACCPVWGRIGGAGAGK